MEEKEKKGKIPRQPMPEQDPKVRIKNNKEVPFGYSPETAMLEASRCIQCKNPGCRAGCPVEIDIPALLMKLKKVIFQGLLPRLRKKTFCPPFVAGSVPKSCSAKRTAFWAKKGSPWPLEDWSGLSLIGSETKEMVLVAGINPL